MKEEFSGLCVLNYNPVWMLKKLKSMLCCKLCCSRPNVIQTDCAGVNHTLEAKSKDTSARCHIYQEIKCWRNNGLCIIVSLVKRDCNTVAHELAKCNSIEGDVDVWQFSVT